MVVAPLGCHWRLAEAFVLPAKQSRWRVQVPPGAYELSASAAVRTPNVSGSWSESKLGLLVDAERASAIVSATGHRVCETPYAGAPLKEATPVRGETSESPRFAIVLESAAGRQEATNASPCLEAHDEGICLGSEGTAGGARLIPERISVVRPGELVRIGMPDAQPHQRVVTVTSLCERQLVSVELLGARRDWRIALAPGAYYVGIWVPWFDIANGPTGTNAAEARIVVDNHRPLRVLPARAVNC